MLKDHNHDLVQQISESSDGVWRMEEYLKNSEGCERCQAMWIKIKDDFNSHVEMLRSEIEQHVKEGKFD